MNCTTFKDYSKKVFLSFILQQFQSGCRRIDIVWDVYLENSLKESARIKRGQGAHPRVLQDQKTPIDWHVFFSADQNKIELFKFLAADTSQLQAGGLVIATHEKSVLSYQILTNPYWHHVMQKRRTLECFFMPLMLVMEVRKKSQSERCILMWLLLVRFNFHDLSKININCIMILYYYCFI